MAHGTPLPALAEAIWRAADEFALAIGLMMDQAKARNKAKYPMWVRTQTPFTLEEAERLRSLAVLLRELPPEAGRELPRPAYALTYVLENEDPAPLLQPTSRLSSMDLAAGTLLGGHPEQLDPVVAAALRRWIGDPSTASASAFPEDTD